VAVLIIALTASACPYSPKFKDCQVRCGDDNACPFSLTCKDGYCRPKGADGVCTCNPNEERACGGGRGECKAGTQICSANRSWGTCLGEVLPTVELCDNKDNDCNGAVDDQVSDAPLCPLTKGVCFNKVQQCIDGAYPGSCSSVEYGNDYQVAETRCDGLDNDCDGTSDGAPPRVLIPQCYGYDIAGFDGGYAVGWLGDDGGTDYVVFARIYDAAMQPTGPPLRIASAGVVRPVFRVVAHDRDVYVAWLDETTQRIGGAAQIWADAPDVSQRLPDFPIPGAQGASLAGTPYGLAAAYILDAGVGLSEWSKDAGRGIRRVVDLGYVGDPIQAMILGQASLTEVSDVIISSSGLSVAFEGYFQYGYDGGSTSNRTYIERTVKLDGTGLSVGKSPWNTVLLDTANGKTQTFFSTQDCTIVFFIPQCTASYVASDTDYFNAASGNRRMKTVGAPDGILYAHAAPFGSDWIGTWTERGTAWVGRYDANITSLRSRAVDFDGGQSVFGYVANAGGPMSLVAHVTNLNIGEVSSALVCAP
jgi:Putative metal-binding motif